MKRPFGVKILLAFGLFFAACNSLRLYKAFTDWNVLREYGANALYIALSGGVWLFASLFLIRGIWFRKPWSLIGTICGAIAYGMWYWFARLVLQIPHANWAFALAITGILAGFFAFIIFHPKIRIYFKN